MICKNCNHENADDALFCSNCGHKLKEDEPTDDLLVIEEKVEAPEEETVETIEETTEAPAEEAEWYYVSNNASTGPFKESEMIRFIETGALKATTYVWKNGMEDWVMLKNSPLASYLKDEQPSQDHPHTYTRTAYPMRVQERSIILSVILSLVTCGIYELVWLYLEAKDINDLLMDQNKPVGTDPILVLLLSVVTCGLYQVYFFYKAGKALNQVDSKGFVGDDSALLALLGFFAPIVSMAIIQNSINTVVKYGE